MAYQSVQRDLRKRIFVLFILIAGATAVLVVRLFTLTVVQGSSYSQAAEDRLDVETLLPTWRGRLLDRKGRVLSHDVASYDLAVSYPLAKREWARERAIASVKGELGNGWRKLQASDRESRIAVELPSWLSKQESLIQFLSTRAGVAQSELDERLAEVATRIDAQASAIFRRQLETRRVRGQSLDVKPEQIREMRETHVIMRGVSDETAFELRKLSDAFPGAIEVVDSALRHEPWETAEVEVSRIHLPRPIRTSIPLVLKMQGALDQVVGSVRNEAWKEDLERRPFERTREDGTLEIDLGGYRSGRDSVGARGMERQFEDQLRGIRGRSTRHLDSSTIERIEPVPGHDVTVSIDAQLQLRVQAALDPRCGLTSVQSWHTHSDALPNGEALPAAAVIVDVQTGEVLAAASTPLPQDGLRAGKARMGSDSASINRAIDAAYPPGSLVKPLVYLAAVAEGLAPEGESIECNGHYFKDRTDAARCWIYRERYKFATHTKSTGGPLGVEEALARSCNIYFYTLADRVGAAKLCAWYRRFGLGILGGTIPSAEAAAKMESKQDHFSTVALGIGQGKMTVTPLEIANAYAMIARGGSVRTPSWVVGGTQTSETFQFAPAAVAHVLDGLEKVVKASYGTAHHMDFGDGSRDPIIEAPGVRLWAKTGTAEASALKVDRDNDGTAERIVTDADHAWCAALVADQGERVPRYAIAVIVEHGGGGGRTAGPVMGAVIRALVSEGYLSGDGPTRVIGDVRAGAVR